MMDLHPDRHAPLTGEEKLQKPIQATDVMGDAVTDLVQQVEGLLEILEEFNLGNRLANGIISRPHS